MLTSLPVRLSLLVGVAVADKGTGVLERFGRAAELTNQIDGGFELRAFTPEISQPTMIRNHFGIREQVVHLLESSFDLCKSFKH